MNYKQAERIPVSVWERIRALFAAVENDSGGGLTAINRDDAAKQMADASKPASRP